MTGARRRALLAMLVLLVVGCGRDSAVVDADVTVGRSEVLDERSGSPAWVMEDLVFALGLTRDRDAGTYVFTSSGGVACFVDGVVTGATEVALHEARGARTLTDPDGEVGVFWYPEPRTSPLQETPSRYRGVPESCVQQLEQKLVGLGSPGGR